MTIDAIFPTRQQVVDDAKKDIVHFPQLPLAFKVQFPGDDSPPVQGYVWEAGPSGSVSSGFNFYETQEQAQARCTATWTELGKLARQAPLIIMPNARLLLAECEDNKGNVIEDKLQNKIRKILGVAWKSRHSDKTGQIIFYNSELIKNVKTETDISDDATQAFSFDQAKTVTGHGTQRILILNTYASVQDSDKKIEDQLKTLQNKILTIPNLNCPKVLFLGRGGFFPIVGKTHDDTQVLMHTGVRSVTHQGSNIQYYESPLYVKPMTTLDPQGNLTSCLRTVKEVEVNVPRLQTAADATEFYEPSELAISRAMEQHKEMRFPLNFLTDELPQKLLPLLDLRTLVAHYTDRGDTDPDILSPDQQKNLVESFIQEIAKFGLDLCVAYRSDGMPVIALKRGSSNPSRLLFDELKSKRLPQRGAASAASTGEFLFSEDNSTLFLHPEKQNDPAFVTEVIFNAMREIRYVLAFKILHNAKRTDETFKKQTDFCATLESLPTFHEKLEAIVANSQRVPTFAGIKYVFTFNEEVFSTRSAKIWSLVKGCDGQILTTENPDIAALVKLTKIPREQEAMLRAMPKLTLGRATATPAAAAASS